MPIRQVEEFYMITSFKNSLDETAKERINRIIHCVGFNTFKYQKDDTQLIVEIGSKKDRGESLEKEIQGFVERYESGKNIGREDEVGCKNNNVEFIKDGAKKSVAFTNEQIEAIKHLIKESQGRKIKKTVSYSVKTKDGKVNNFTLTSRESDILKYLTQGKRNSEIARIMNISPSSVTNGNTMIFSKLGVNNRIDAAVMCRELDFVKIGEY